MVRLTPPQEHLPAEGVGLGKPVSGGSEEADGLLWMWLLVSTEGRAATKSS